MSNGSRLARRTLLRSILLAGILIASIAGVIVAQNTPASEGQAIFEQKCLGCHTIGQGPLVGPDLKDISSQRDPEWLVQWIVAPDKMIADGDATAIALTEQYPGIVMPNLGLTETEARAVLAYIDSQSGGAAAASPVTTAIPLTGDVSRGKDYFTGNTRFSGGGPSCMACHSVSGIGALGGGQLGPDLTQSVSKYGGPAGLTAFLGNPPTQTMSVIWGSQPLTPQEQADLVAYLEQASLTARPANAIVRLSALAVVGALLFLGLMQLIWRGRLRGVRRSMVTGKR